MSSKLKLRVSRLEPIRLITTLLLRMAALVISSLLMCQSFSRTICTQQQQRFHGMGRQRALV